eukprot:TRINITY_DN17576_c0_g1_i1.p1 TRINITY_DN17576_c0_g1~~TRINITY_DN17576_c0_g1_i1.p1  ORF type:complete len:925 (-),score=271.70 TRINITY_DN17576_c0_g1_i1:183-2957(-)
MAGGRVDITNDAILLLRAINETNGRFGFNMPIEVLLGQRHAKIKKNGFDNVSCHGAGKHRSAEQWKAVSSSLLQELLVDARGMPGAKGGGKRGKGGVAMSIYSVSELGKQLLEGHGQKRVFADVEADCQAAEQVRLERAAKRARRSSVQAPPPAASAAAAAAREVSNTSPSQQGRPRGASAVGLSPSAATAAALSPEAAGNASDKGRKRQLPPTMQPQPAPGGGSSSSSAAPPAQRPPPRTAAETLAAAALPPALEKVLMPFQREGVAFAINRAGRVLIGDEMGLGKTLQAIATCCAFKKEWPVLVVVPSSVRATWADELERWIPDLGPGGVNVIKTSSDVDGLKQGTASFHVVTYSILTRTASEVQTFLRQQNAFKTIVVDECHMIKNRSTGRTREIMQFAKKCTRVVLLSGTPALARPVELYTQIEVVEPGLFKSYSSFTQRYCAPKWTPFGQDLNGASNLQELHEKLKPIMVRRLKAEVLTQLPAKRRQRIPLELSQEALKLCAEKREELYKLAAEEDSFERKAVMMAMYRETGLAKRVAACEYVEDLLNGGCKIIVFGHHLAVLDALQETVKKLNMKHIRIDGSTSSEERRRQVDVFQADKATRVAILGMQAAGVGITLTAASTVVFVELHWTPGILLQAEDRAHRIGQVSSVNIHYLVAPGTVDDFIWPSVSKKIDIVSRICDGKRDKLAATVSSADRAIGEAGLASAEVIEDDMDKLVSNVAKRESATVARKGKATAAPAPENSVLSMLQGKRAAAEDAIEDVSASEAEGGDTVGRANFSFWVSRVTGRLHVLDGKGDPLGYNMKLMDWSGLADEECPEALAKHAGAMAALGAFMQQWAGLKVGEQRTLTNQVVRLPLRDQLKSSKAGGGRRNSVAAAAAPSSSAKKGGVKSALKKAEAAPANQTPVYDNAIDVLDSQ